VLSIFSALPPLIYVLELIYLRRSDLSSFFRRFPRSFLAEAKLLITGKGSDNPVGDTNLPIYVTLDPDESTLGTSDDRSIQEAAAESVPFPEIPLQLMESPTYRPCQSPLEEPKEVMVGPSGSPIHSERKPQDDRAPVDG
jgi:hypothetical protein